MANVTLVGPGASVDRSGNNGFTWTWTPSITSEQMHRWRLQYRLVGSGTWLNAYDPIETNLLPNGSAESAITDWSTNDSYKASLNRVAGNRVAASGSWLIEHICIYVDEYSVPGSVMNVGVLYPGFSQTLISVVPGARYVANGWLAMMDAPGSGGTLALPSMRLVFYKADGVTGTGITNTWGALAVGSGAWQNVASEAVAPADAAFARIAMTTPVNYTVGSKCRIDEVTLQRVDNASHDVATDATGNAWSYKWLGSPTPGQCYLPPNFLAAGNWEFRLETWSSATTIAPTQSYSNTVTSTMVTAAAAPTITVPATNGTVIVTNPSNVTATYASGQVQMQVRVLDGATEVYNSGTLVVSGTTATHSTPFATNGVNRTIQVRTGVSGVFSSWATRTVSVLWTPPATPTFTSVSEDTYGLGFRHAVKVTVTNPTPTGTQPTVTDMVLEWRPSGTTAWKIAVAGPPGTPLYWYAPPDIPMQVRLTVRAANGTATTTGAQNVTPDVDLRGVVLYDPLDPSTVKVFRLNDEGLEDDHQVESALMAFSGREFPIAEYGAATTRKMSVPALHLRTDADVAALRAFLTIRRNLVYRDRRGRAALVRITLGPIRDTFYGYDTSLAMDVLDSWGV